MEYKDYYKLLGVEKKASEADIKRFLTRKSYLSVASAASHPSTRPSAP